jgi:hypothetical protein
MEKQPTSGVLFDPICIDPYWNELHQVSPGDKNLPTLQDIILITVIVQLTVGRKALWDRFSIDRHTSPDFPIPYIGINYSDIREMLPILGLNTNISIYKKVKRLVDLGYLVEPLPRPKSKVHFIQVSLAHLEKMKTTLNALKMTKLLEDFSRIAAES